MPIGTIVVAFMSISIVACTFLFVAENVVGFLEFFEHLGVPAFVWEQKTTRYVRQLDQQTQETDIFLSEERTWMMLYAQGTKGLFDGAGIGIARNT
jgi:hypothetical protein